MSMCTIDLGSRRNLVSEIPDVRSGYNNAAYSNLGPAERAEMLRADKIDRLVTRNQKMERRNFKGYE